MGKGRFVNQKLGKSISRKVDLLKIELAARPRKQVAITPSSSKAKRGKKS